MGLGRHFLAAAVMASLGACTVPSVRTAGDTSALNIVSVSVDTSTMTVEGRELKRTRAQLDTDLEAAIAKALAPESDPSGTPVEVALTISNLRLAPPLERVVAGTSSVTGEITLTEIGTGRPVVAPTQLTGNTKNLRAAGVIGLATTMTIENDYRGTIEGFANTIRKALFGSEQ